jgi:uncharacterized membrane protein
MKVLIMPHALPQHFAQPSALPEVHRVTFDRPLYWLRAGWRDIAASPAASLFHGFVFAFAGALILLLAMPYPHLFSLAVSGFFLVAPLLATGLYEISRRHERDEPADIGDSFAGWRRNGESIALFGLALALVGILWERLSAILFGLLYRGGYDATMNFFGFLGGVVFSGENLGFAATWLFVGGALALFVFACSAVSIPMLVDRDNGAGGDIATAILTSLRAVSRNLPAMAVWALLLVALTLLGMATLLLGLVVLMPLLGHASWHAYRDLVAPAPLK